MNTNNEQTCEATPREELRRQIMSSGVPKNEREWWASSEIEKLERQLNEFHKHLTAVMPNDFKDWHENSKEEWPEIAGLVIKNLRERVDNLHKDIDKLHEENKKLNKDLDMLLAITKI